MASDKLKIACISDTHDLYYPVIPDDVDAIIHAGDITLSGSPKETFHFIEWFSQQKAKHKIFIGGNHDRYLEQSGAWDCEGKPIQMLWDSSYDLEGYKVWGSPYSTTFMDWFFMKDPEEMEEHWSKIPRDTDILVTHGPARGHLDRAVPIRGHEHLGDIALRTRIWDVAPLYHICGHIHGSRGMDRNSRGTTFINAAVLDEAYRPWAQRTIVIELPRKAAEESNVDRIRDTRV